MRTITLVSLVLVAGGALSASAQTGATTKPSAPSAAPSATANSAATPTGVRSPQMPGYQLFQIQGFSLVVSDETVGHLNDPEYKKSWYQVLDEELQAVVGLLRPEQVAILRKLLIFVEWDKTDVDLEGGRPGGAAGIYSPRTPEQMVADGFHPLQSKNVTILMMKAITRSRQGEHDRKSCILLHEMAHAVHDRFYGFDHKPIALTYDQAMQRRLYDSTAYLATNRFEYFACITDAYFNQGGGFPRTADDLKKHDPAAFTLMESCWGKRTPSAATATESPAATALASDVKLDDVDFGAAVLGELPTAASLKGRPVLLVLWNNDIAWTQRVVPWHAELSEFGLAVVATHLAGVGQQTDVKGLLERRNVKFPGTERPWRSGDLVKSGGDFPLCYVFDPAGACRYVGSPFNAEEHLRRVVTEFLLADLGPEPLPKPIAAIATQLRGGKRPTDVVPSVATATRSTDKPTKAAADLLLARITVGAEKRLAEAERLSASDPVEAFMQIASLPTTYRGTTVALRATALATKLKRHKQVGIEFAAQPAMQQVNRLDYELSTKPNGYDPTIPQFQSDNAPLLQQLRATVGAMKQAWPDSRTTAEALRIARQYGVTIP